MPNGGFYPSNLLDLMLARLLGLLPGLMLTLLLGLAGTAAAQSGLTEEAAILAEHTACPATPSMPPHAERPETNRRFYLTGVLRLQEQFRVDHGDTLWRRYEAVALRMEGSDTVQLREVYRRGKEWTLYRFRRVDGAFVPEGQQVDLGKDGRPSLVLLCPTGETRCRDWERLTWWPNDTLARAGTFHNGRADGLHSAWYPDGRLRACLRYADGRLVTVEGLWGPSGEALPTGSFQDGEGWVPQYALNGVPIRERRYHKGLRRGMRTVPGFPPTGEEKK